MRDKTIMLVDDDDLTLTILEKILEEQYIVIKATSGKQCLHMLEAGRIPDMIFLDINMPEMSGVETQKKIAGMETAKKIPIVFLTGIDDDETEAKALSAEVMDYIKKPVSKQVLLSRIQKYFEHLEKKNANMLDLDKIAAIEEPLTEKEYEVTKLLALFYSDVEIAELLYISLPYAKRLVGNVKYKLGLDKRGDIRRYFLDEDVSIDGIKFMSYLLELAAGKGNLAEVIDRILEYIGTQIGADRALIFEKNSSNRYDNTYEWCDVEVNSKEPALEDVDGTIWIDEFEHNDYVYIENTEIYRAVSKRVYDNLTARNIQSFIAAPIIIDSEYEGFFIFDNPSVYRMQQVQQIVRLFPYIFSLIIRLRDSN